MPRLGITQTISISSSSAAASNPFGAQTYQVRISTDTNVNFVIGDGAQTATASDPFLPENRVEIVTVSPGQQIAAIEAATDGLVTGTSGTLWVTELDGE
jgi:hypothetical protein